MLGSCLVPCSMVESLVWGRSWLFGRSPLRAALFGCGLFYFCLRIGTVFLCGSRWLSGCSCQIIEFGDVRRCRRGTASRNCQELIVEKPMAKWPPNQIKVFKVTGIAGRGDEDEKQSKMIQLYIHGQPNNARYLGSRAATLFLLPSTPLLRC